MGRFINFGFIDWDTIHCWGDSFESIPPGCQVAPEWHYFCSKKSISIKPWFAPGVWGVDGFETPAETWRSFLTTQIFPPIWRFFIHKWFSPVFFGFSTCWSYFSSLKKKSWKTWRIDGPCRVRTLKVGFYRGVGVRLLCRSQSLLRPLTAERSTEGPVCCVKRCVFWCGPQWVCAPEKNGKGGVFVKNNGGHQINIIWFILILAFGFGMAHPQVLLLVGQDLDHQVNQRRSRFLLQCVQQLRYNLRRVGGGVVGSSRVAGNVSAALGWRQVEGPKFPKPLKIILLQKWCNKRS